MKTELTAILICALALTDANSQQEPAKISFIAGQDSLEMGLRVLQYEILLGTELNSLVAICIDKSHRTSWMLPESSATKASATAIESIRRTAEICQAATRRLQSTEGQSLVMQLASDIRTSLEFQLQTAHALEASKRTAQNCIAQSKTDENFKTCMAAVRPSLILAPLWPKWLSIFGRRISIAANAPTGN